MCPVCHARMTPPAGNEMRTRIALVVLGAIAIYSIYALVRHGQPGEPPEQAAKVTPSYEQTSRGNPQAPPPASTLQGRVQAADAQTRLPPPSGPSTEIGRLVLLLMPDIGQRSLTWDYRSDTRIRWVDPGYRTVSSRLGEVNERRGVIRTNVHGETSSVLRQRREELWWTVSLSTHSPAKFGPEAIGIDPGEPDEPCFGSLYEGCTFDPLPSIAAAGVQATPICRATKDGTELAAFTLHHPGRGDIELIVMNDGGSGGTSTSLEMRFADDLAKLCTLGSE
jgi:hypothetical protein